MTTSTVAALLTILGFSLYDTIIVFDRVRENIPRMPSAAFSQIVNRSMSEVIDALAGDELLHALPVLALLLFGGDTLKDFAFALLVGVASGTYSSIFIAEPGARRTGRSASRSTRRARRASATSSARCRPTRPPPRAARRRRAVRGAAARRARRRPIRPRASRRRSSTTWSPTSGSRKRAARRRRRRRPRAPQRPVGGRRARSRAAGTAPGAEGEARTPKSGDGEPEHRRRPPNRRHGRTR